MNKLKLTCYYEKEDIFLRVYNLRCDIRHISAPIVNNYVSN